MSSSDGLPEPYGATTIRARHALPLRVSLGARLHLITDALATLRTNASPWLNLLVVLVAEGE